MSTNRATRSVPSQRSPAPPRHPRAPDRWLLLLRSETIRATLDSLQDPLHEKRLTSRKLKVMTDRVLTVTLTMRVSKENNLVESTTRRKLSTAAEAFVKTARANGAWVELDDATINVSYDYHRFGYQEPINPSAPAGAVSTSHPRRGITEQYARESRQPGSECRAGGVLSVTSEPLGRR